MPDGRLTTSVGWFTKAVELQARRPRLVGADMHDEEVDQQPVEGARIEPPWFIPREYENGGVRWFSVTVGELQRTLHPLLAEVRRVELADTPPTAPAEGESLPEQASSLYRQSVISHEWTVSVEDVVAFAVDQFLADVHAVADNTGGQMVRALLELVSDVTEEHGNVIIWGGRDFFDVLAETFETIDMTFDDDGRHNLTLVLHPDQIDELKDKKPTPEQDARINAILDRRREEWRASRRRRDLP